MINRMIDQRDEPMGRVMSIPEVPRGTLGSLWKRPATGSKSTS